MERPQALKFRHRNSLKKIRRYSYCTKRSAVIPTAQKDPPLSLKGADLLTIVGLFALVAVIDVVVDHIFLAVKARCS